MTQDGYCSTTISALINSVNEAMQFYQILSYVVLMVSNLCRHASLILKSKM